MQFSITILNLIFTLVNFIILVFLSVFLVRFRDSLLNKDELPPLNLNSNSQLDELTAAGRRLTQNLNPSTSNLQKDFVS